MHIHTFSCHVHIHAHAHIRMHRHMYIDVYVCMIHVHIRIHVQIHMHINMHVRRHIQTYETGTCTFKRTTRCARIHFYTGLYVHASLIDRLISDYVYV